MNLISNVLCGNGWHVLYYITLYIFLLHCNALWPMDLRVPTTDLFTTAFMAFKLLLIRLTTEPSLDISHSPFALFRMDGSLECCL